jgi:GNAT superfamily N-acetyltransferase
MITFRQELLNTTEDEAKELLELHYAEIALNKDKIKLNPNWEAYHELEDNNNLKIFTARDSGKLVGYFVVIVGTSLHYKDHLFAENDILYLHKDYRKGWTGIRLIRFVENCMLEDGVSLMKINTKVHQNFGVILDRLGFNNTEEVYTKYLGE